MLEEDRIHLFSGLETLTKENIFKLVIKERDRQDIKYGSIPTYTSFPDYQIVLMEDLERLIELI